MKTRVIIGNKGVMVMMEATRRRRAMKVKRALRRRKSPMMRGWNTMLGQFYPPSVPQVRPLIGSSGVKITSRISMVPVI